MVYVKHVYYYLIYLIEKFILRRDNPRIPIILKLSNNISEYIISESVKRGISSDDFVNLILKEVIDETESK